MFTDKKKFILAVIMLLAWMTAMFLMSHQTAKESSNLSYQIAETSAQVIESTGVIEKVNMNTWHSKVRVNGHFIEYLILNLLTMNVIYRLKNNRLSILYSLLFCVLFSISDEVHQLFRQGRDFQVIDLFVDFLGSTMGVKMAWVISRIVQRRRLDNKVIGAFERYVERD